MNTYDTEPKTAAKDEVLFKNGITPVDVDEGQFLQYNDYFEHKTFYQCPRCKSLNNETEKYYFRGLVGMTIRQCEDCGYKHTNRFSEVNND